MTNSIQNTRSTLHQEGHNSEKTESASDNYLFCIGLALAGVLVCLLQVGENSSQVGRCLAQPASSLSGRVSPLPSGSLSRSGVVFTPASSFGGAGKGFELLGGAERLLTEWTKIGT